MRTLMEKLEYNKRRRSSFGVGYTTGVTLYSEYSKLDKESKRLVKETITDARELAKQGDKYGKGFMCGVRDAANERKKAGVKRSTRVDL